MSRGKKRKTDRKGTEGTGGRRKAGMGKGTGGRGRLSGR